MINRPNCMSVSYVTYCIGIPPFSRGQPFPPQLVYHALFYFSTIVCFFIHLSIEQTSFSYPAADIPYIFNLYAIPFLVLTGQLYHKEKIHSIAARKFYMNLSKII